MSEDNRCKHCRNCRHWEMLGVRIAGYCGVAEVVETSKLPEQNGFGSRAIMPNENTHHVITGKDFGCVHWSPKP